VDEIGKHAEGGDQSDDLHETPKGEEDSEKHFDGVTACARRCLRLLMKLRRGWSRVRSRICGNDKG